MKQQSNKSTQGSQIMRVIIMAVVFLVGGILSGKTAPQEMIQEDDIVQWKTYRDEKSGYEIEYPQNFFLEETVQQKPKQKGPYTADSDLRINLPKAEQEPKRHKPTTYYTYWRIFTPEEWRDKGVHNPFIGIIVIKTKLSASKWLEEKGTEVSVFDDLGNIKKEKKEKILSAVFYGVRNVKELTIGNNRFLTFYSFAFSGSDHHALIKGKNNTLIDIHNHASGMGEIPEDIYNRMLSTFRFIE